MQTFNGKVWRRRSVLVAAAATVGLVVGGLGVAFGAGSSQAVACSYDGANLTCPLPQVTVTQTVTATPSSVAASSLPESSAAGSSGPTSTASSTTASSSTSSVPTSVPTTASSTTTSSATTSSGPPVVTTVDDAQLTGSNHFTYTGASWTVCGCNGSSFHYAYTAGDKTVFTFTGTQAALFGFKESAGGIASVSVDGGAAVDADLYAAATSASAVQLWASPALPSGPHTVSFSVSGRQGPNSLSPTINIDYAKVTSNGAPSTTTATSATSSATSAPSTTASTKGAAWLSGESANNVLDTFGAWRGRSIEIGGTWGATDTWADMEASPAWTVGPSGAWANTPAMDYAMNAFPDEVNSGQNWTGAASGAYDAHWTTIIQNLKAMWGSRPAGNMYIRFAHEMNGNWYGHSVPPSQIGNFKAAWVRIFDIVRANFPGAKLVWSVNHDSSWPYSEADIYPGDSYVDVVDMDSYNNYPHCTDAASCTAKFNMTQNGGPAGIETLRQFAQAHGKSFAISEWANAAVAAGGGGGDDPAFIQAFHDWLVAHAGTGPGQVLYEVMFNTPGFADHYEMFPTNQMPNSAALYKQLWSS